jgi:gluconate 2-dehydrogenase gamma chain
MSDDAQRLFFDEHQWETVSAACSRIIPTDEDPGAAEAGVVGFIDQYLSSIDYVYANAWGSGFDRLEGRQREAWQRRIDRLQERYRNGLEDLDRISVSTFGAEFRELSAEQQDDALVALSGKPKPAPIDLSADEGEPASTNGDAPIQAGGDAVLLSQPVTDETLDFFGTLVLHTRMGFYGDPAYGGNRDHMGWRTIGFPGPASLADTHGAFSTMEYMEEMDYATLAGEGEGA